MAEVTVRITKKSYSFLRQMARNTGEPISALLERGIEDYRRTREVRAVQRFWKEASADFARLRSDPVAWKEELRERVSWSISLPDEAKGAQLRSRRP